MAGFVVAVVDPNGEADDADPKAGVGFAVPKAG